jgi:hypothetical protein
MNSRPFYFKVSKLDMQRSRGSSFTPGYVQEAEAKSQTDGGKRESGWNTEGEEKEE